MASIGRVLPHSLEAEEYLVSCCLLDAADVLPRCIEARITPDSFYEPKHGIIYGHALNLHTRGLPVEISVVAEELKAARELDQIGGYGFLSQVTSRIPTTAQASYFIEKVREQALLRELIRTATGAVEDCYGFSGGIDEFIGTISRKMEAVRSGANVMSQGVRGALSFTLPPEEDSTSLLGRHRYIGRGDGALIVSSSGMGKSVLQVEWAIHCALGRPFLGIETKGPLTSLVIQSEDSDGDIGEIIFSVCTALKLTQLERAKVNERVLFRRDKVNRGDAFISSLRSLVAKYKPDLVWLNPLHAFAGCDIADAEKLGNFLRGGLNGVNKDDAFAYMIVHHTPKPMTGKGVADKKWHEFMYDAAGSAELVNWSRAVLTLKPTETEGQFNLILAKRGKRAGVMIEAAGEADGVTRLELTTKIPIAHSSRQVEIEGRKHPFSIVHWETRTADAKPSQSESAKGKRPEQFEEAYSDGDLVTYFPASDEEPASFGATHRFAMEGCGVSKVTFARRQKKLVDSELIQQTTDRRWKRTARGDNLAKDTLQTRK